VKYLLDTNTVSFALRGVGRVGERLLAESPARVGISAITESELWFAVHRVGSPKLRQAVEGFLSALIVVPFDSSAAREYGELRARLEQRGTPIGVAETMIAAHARAMGACLVTNNTKHFSRVPRLRVQDWR
jgi:tRNA(fMet)-specific endonuclease VapC